MTFRVGIVAAMLVLLGGIGASRAEIVVTDIAGRRVEIAAPARRIVLGASAYYPALSLLSRDSASLVVGVGGLQSSGGLFEAERDLADKPRLGSIWSQTFSIEKALALKPDLLIATNPDFAQSRAVDTAFAKAGVPVVYVDFFLDPARNTAPSIAIIGRAIGEEERAAELVDFYRSRMDRVFERLRSAAPDRPKILINSRRPDLACCWALARGSVAAYFSRLGVNNIAEGRLPGEFGQLSLEYIIESDPDIFVATDLSTGPNSLFGQPRSSAQGVASLERLAAEPGLRDLSAMRSRRVHAIEVSLMRSPLNILALENFAKWIHPELFADLDPQATLDEINRRFLATPLAGPFWASLGAAAGPPSGARP